MTLAGFDGPFNGAHLKVDYEGLATESNATMVFGHDPDQIKRLRVAPTGSYR